MLKQLNSSETFAYADDTAIVVAHEKLESAINIIQSELNIISRWCHDNGLVINAAKTKLMHIKLPSVPSCVINIKFHNYDCLHKNKSTSALLDDKCDTLTESVNTYKYLGVMVDSNFSWKIHIQNLNKKLRSAGYAIFHLGNYAPLDVTKQAYFSLAESYIRHGITAFGNTSHFKIIQKTQNRLLKILIKSKPVHSQPQINLRNANPHNSINQIYTHNVENHNIKEFAKTHNILTVKNIYKTTIINEFYDDSSLLPINHQYNTRRRAEGRYNIPRFNNKYGKNTIDIQLPSVLNAIQPNVLCLQNRFKRKNEIKKFFINSQ